MNSFKLLVVFIPLLFGSFAQRFQRHLINGTQNGLVNGTAEWDNLDSLASDGEIYEQNGGDVKFVRDGGNVELELEKKELKFEFCSDGCMDKEVIACYDSSKPNPNAKGDCDSNQCEFRAGVSETGEDPILWFKDKFHLKFFRKNNGICKMAIMKFPDAKPDGMRQFASCEPLKHDGNVIKLYVHQVPPGCPFFVLNAKKWTPPSTAATQNSSETTLITTAKSSEANITLWILIGVGIFILLIVVIGFGYCCYRNQLQKKPLSGKKNDVQQKAIMPESLKAEVVKEKIADEKEVVAKPKPPKEPTAAKEKPPKPAKEKISKEKKAPIVEPKPSKEMTQEDNPPPAKNPTTEASVVQKPVVQQKQYHTGNPPRVYVPHKVILPEPKSVNAPKSGSLKTGKKDSLSGRHEIGMEGLVQSAPEQVKRHDINIGLLNDDVKERLEKFYPPGPVRTFDPREIEILCCARISIMFKIIEALIDDAMKALKERGVTFDEKSNIIEMPPKAEKYLRSKKTPEYVRTCTWIRRQLPVIQKEFSAEERSELAFPICAIEAAYKMNADGFNNVFLLDSLSGVDDDETQHSTHESGKLGKK
uniref:Uncharacterized protein n=1 Tax=Panagrolaimus davidi TaxID=227884 RepID=A0A914Q636_9BILA